jgi:small multidrug resistance family-3 protein
VIPQSLGLFAVAGLCEIGGGYLVWQALREGRGPGYAVAGALILVLYGVIPTLQPEAAFGRVYAAYGGCFVVLAMVWGAAVDRWSPDGWDLAGAALALVGMAVMMWAPRH